MTTCTGGRAPCIVENCSDSCVGNCVNVGCNNECSSCSGAQHFNPNWTCLWCHANCGIVCWSAYSSYLSSDGTCGGCSGISIKA